MVDINQQKLNETSMAIASNLASAVINTPNGPRTLAAASNSQTAMAQGISKASAKLMQDNPNFANLDSNVQAAMIMNEISSNRAQYPEANQAIDNMARAWAQDNNM